MTTTIEEYTNTNRVYWNIIGGSLRRKVDPDTPGAVIREYETKDGGKAVKHELVVKAITGKVADLSVQDSEFGEKIVIEFEPDEQGKIHVVSIPLDSGYGESFLHIAPNIDFEKPIRLMPYNIKDENSDKVKRGIVVYQDEEKVPNFFFDTEKKEPKVKEYPMPPKDTSSWTSTRWKAFFIERRAFLLDYFKENIESKFIVKKQEANKPLEKPEFDDDEANPDDIPF